MYENSGCNVSEKYGLLTHERLREVLVYDVDTGVFYNKVKRGPRGPIGAQAGSCNAYGYIDIQIDNKSYRSSRLAMFYVYGFIVDLEVDHRDTNRKNNAFSNLRYATRSRNLLNKAVFQENTISNLIGAHSLRGKWQSRIKIDGKTHYLGVFDNKQDAHEAYMNARKCLLQNTVDKNQE